MWRVSARERVREEQTRVKGILAEMDNNEKVRKARLTGVVQLCLAE